MSYTFQAPGHGSENTVDFDFFDDPGARESPPNLGKYGTLQKDVKTIPNVKHDSVSDKHSKDGRQSSVTNVSDSYSSDYSDDSSSDSCSESDSQIKGSVRKIEAKIPQVEPEMAESPRRDDSDDDEKNTTTTSRAPRPKTSLQSRDKQRSHSYSSGSDHSTYTTDSDSDTDSNTDSDVTDVSPLHSPHAISRQIQKDARRGKPPKSPGHKEVTFRSRPTSATSTTGSSRNALIRADSDDIDLRLLMQAVMEMEQNHNPKLVTPGYNINHSLLIQRHPTSADRKNFSFSNDNVRTIDKENQRLMHQIMENAARAKKAKTSRKVQTKSPATTNKMSSSAINRNREQMRIERENYMMLRRLTVAKPTTKLARDHLIKDYDEQVLFGCSVAAAHPTPKKKKAPSPYTVSFNPRFTTPDNEATSEICGEKRVRPVSAKVNKSRPLSAKPQATRPLSATTRVTRPWSASSAGKKRPTSAKLQATIPEIISPVSQGPKPVWNDRWQAQ